MRKRLRKPLIPAIIALIALGVWAEVKYGQRLEQRDEARVETAPTSPSASPLPIAELRPSPKPTASIPAVFTPPDEAALIELDKVGLMLRDYRTIAGENPVGTNAEIMAAVMGENPRQAKLGPPEGMKLNDKGELLDRWETPYFFHQISKNHMEIRSAGPNKILWSDDDPVMK
jgi:hypothetical protein